MDRIRCEYLREKIEELPKGNITYKTIRGKKYPYLQWSEEGKQHNRLVKEEEIEYLTGKIKERKTLEQELVKESEGNRSRSLTNERTGDFFSEVKCGKELLPFVEPVLSMRKRSCFRELNEYVFGKPDDRIMILYGLRRTGKTTLIRQVISEMPEETLEKTAFIQVSPNMNLAKINMDLHRLEKQGYRYIFVDEVTLMEDFIEGAALFSDIFAADGMKLILSGTDSLGFLFSESESLYDRCYMIHTTFVPYREFETVLGIQGIDAYIRYGGTMSAGGTDYNRTGSIFATRKSTSEYVDSAIARNIQHSLRNYQYGGHFRNLRELYEADELTGAINRVVEDINHRFTLEVLTRDFQSNDLALSAKNLLKDRQKPSTVLYEVNREQVTEELRRKLEIKNEGERKVVITDAHRAEIKEYLDLMDITADIDLVTLLDLNRKEKRTVFTQPGIRYAQADALVRSLMRDEVFRALSLSERDEVTNRILSDIRGRMMEDIVLLETKKACPDKEVFKLLFATGEFDMVAFDPAKGSCSVFEIKHSTETFPDQARHLNDKEKLEQTAFRFGPITGKTVLYRGKTKEAFGVQYRNVEEYLNGLG